MDTRGSQLLLKYETEYILKSPLLKAAYVDE